MTLSISQYMHILLAAWIAVFEGFFKPGTVARRNNNPGNLRRWGDRPIRDGFAVFDTPFQGFNALLRQVSLNINRDLTLREFFAGKPGVYPGYAPAEDDNDPLGYARWISDKTNIPLTGMTIREHIEILEQFFPTIT